MKILQAIKTLDSFWQYTSGAKEHLNNPLVLIFAERKLLEDPEVLEDIREEFPYHHLIFGSAAGEITGEKVTENSIAVTLIEFEKASFEVKTANILDFNKNGEALGYHLASQFEKENLKHFFIVSEGSFVNGSSLIKGIEKYTKQKITLTGGLCGDGARFEKTLASYNENPKEGEIIMIGLYGASLEVTYASYGGWIPFGPERIITKSKGNVLIELDDLPALDLYSKYLGDKAQELPQAALLYPLNVTEDGKSYSLVRTILNIDVQNKSMILAGDVPEGAHAQLMMATVDGIALGAATAASKAIERHSKLPELAVLVSCIGRRIIMDQRVEEEIEEVSEILGKQAKIAGFYSYGEIAPYATSMECNLHNQTMTLTLISE
ncbi:FIST C-terminal domain-containing protein [Zunongwangia sp. SCSIO 43204]|uniref:FIST signal transduction protein n=1 Tax=Zunongwangia sp. SCSIO 43204 TaxID=2779359 RepID=UPI001CA8B151|nr:FIST N-terminal domain-containing protein [Zunongwangia sp. SCSIO 43204]UAB84445.1 FIST C-terminal domain-containing protein [Zunongwangia sp. SCSIO 43204]